MAAPGRICSRSDGLARRRGLAGPRVARGSVVVEVELSRPGLEVADPGQFDGVEYFRQSHGRRQNSSIARANALRFTTPYLEPGATVSTGPLLLADGQARMTARVSYRDPDSGRRAPLGRRLPALAEN